MNMKKWIALSLAALMLISVLAGCGAERKNTAKDELAAEEVPMEYSTSPEGIYDSTIVNRDPVSGDYEASTDKVTVTQQKLIRRVSLNTETEDIDPLLAAIDSKVDALGGYIENREVYTGSRYSSQSGRRANLTVRIPKDKMDEFVAHVGNESNVTSSSESSDDVTLTYVAVQSRMTALQKEEARLLELIDKAANLTDLLELEERLTQVRTELESVTSELLLYDNLVDFGTIDISIQEVQTLTPTEEPGFGSQIATGFTGSLQGLWNFLKELVIFLVTALPYLVPLALTAVLLLVIIRRSIRKKEKEKSKKEPPFHKEAKE